MQLSLIVAMAENRVIGQNNQLPWHLPMDMRHFKQTTLGHPVIMGRKTFESLKKPLVDRHNIVLTHQPTWAATGCTVVTSIAQALKAATPCEEAFVIGGAAIYQAFLPYVRKIYLTQVHAQLSGDSFFPYLDDAQWHITQQETYEADEKNAFACTFKRLERT